MAKVILKNVKKIYPFVSGEEKKSKKKKKDDAPEKPKANLQITDKGVVAVQEFNLEIADKEFIVLVGPSGCGKSTTLRMIAGLEEISEGEFYIGDKLMNDVEPKDRDNALLGDLEVDLLLFRLVLTLFLFLLAFAADERVDLLDVLQG